MFDDQFAHRRGESHLGEHLRVQGADGGPQSGDSFAQRGVEAVKSLRGGVVAKVVEIQPDGKQVLQRPIVE